MSAKVNARGVGLAGVTSRPASASSASSLAIASGFLAKKYLRRVAEIQKCTAYIAIVGVLLAVDNASD